MMKSLETKLQKLLFMIWFLLILFLSGRAGAFEELKIGLSWDTNVEEAGLLVAIDKSWFEDNGIKIKIIPYQAVNMMEQIAEGSINIGIEDSMQFIDAHAKGLQLKAIGVKFQTNPIVLVTLDQKIEKIDDFVARHIVVAKGRSFLVKNLLRHLNISKNALQVTYFSNIGDSIKMLISGKYDGAFVFEPNEVVSLRLSGYNPKVFRSEEFGADVYGHVWITSTNMIKNNPELIEKFLKINIQGWQTALRDINGAAEMITKKYYPHNPQKTGIKTAEQHLKQQILELRLFSYYMRKGVGDKIGMMRASIWERNIKTLKEIGFIKNKILKPDSFYTIEFINKIYSNGKSSELHTGSSNL